MYINTFFVVYDDDFCVCIILVGYSSSIYISIDVCPFIWDVLSRRLRQGRYSFLAIYICIARWS